MTTATPGRYETAHELSERTGKTDTVVCTECGAFVMNTAAHDCFHDEPYGQRMPWLPPQARETP